MGNWRHRPPRRLYHHNNHHYDYQLPDDCSDDNVPQWEKKFCFVVGSVPWRKVVSTKYFTTRQSNVLEWNDLAVKETFEDAKKRFWAEMNGLHCDVALPDPDIYIDEVDWNMKVDLELINEVEREYFAPVDDEAEVSNKLLRKFKRMRNSGRGNYNWNGPIWEGSNNSRVNGVLESKEIKQSDWNNCAKVFKSEVDNESSWEVKAAPTNLVSNKNPWGQDKDRVSDENPWEQANQGSILRKDNGWGGFCNGNKFDGCDSTTKRDSDQNPWERSNQSLVIKKADGWGEDCDKDWGWSQRDWKWNISMNGESRSAQSSTHQYNRGKNNRGSRQWTSYRNQNKDFDFRREASNGNNYNSLVREGNHNNQNEFGYRNTMFRSDENQGSDCWVTNRGNNKRRVSFE